MKIKDFMKHNYRHFNAAVCVDAAEAWVRHLKSGGKMFITLAGAMSTAEIGVSLAELIRQDKVHGISCTGANLEEDIFNLVAHSHYERIPNYRNLKPEEEIALRDRGMNRVTDTCIPEEEAMRRVERELITLWMKAEKEGKRYFPYEYFYQLIENGAIKNWYEIDPKDSWVMAAYEKKLPIFSPGWEDSTIANVFVAAMLRGDVKKHDTVRSGVELMASLVDWYKKTSSKSSIGFFQVGGGIAGDFPICVVPLINQDLREDARLWGYFCQISDCTTSYGSYSGAVPSEKISWGKLEADTPSFIIESDASIVAPLVFNYVLES